MKAGADELRAILHRRHSGTIRGYVGEGRFTDDPLNTFGGAGVVEIPDMQKLLHYICENGFEHHVAANFSTTAAPCTRPDSLPRMADALASKLISRHPAKKTAPTLRDFEGWGFFNLHTSAIRRQSRQ